MLQIIKAVIKDSKDETKISLLFANQVLIILFDNIINSIFSIIVSMPSNCSIMFSKKERCYDVSCTINYLYFYYRYM